MLPFEYSNVVITTASNEHAFYSFTIAVTASAEIKVDVKDFEIEHFACFGPSE
jgi:hypothetical protein